MTRDAVTVTLNEDRLMAFVGKAIGDFGALVSGTLVVVGDRLGLREIITGAGFGTVRRVAESPLNMVLEAKP